MDIVAKKSNVGPDGWTNIESEEIDRLVQNEGLSMLEATTIVAESSNGEAVLAAPNNTYLGKIVLAQEGAFRCDSYLIQDVGRGKFIAHSLDSLDREMQVGELVTIKYNDVGQGSVIPRAISKSTAHEH